MASKDPSWHPEFTGKRLSFVIPVYNEEDCLPVCLSRLKRVKSLLPIETEIIFIDDGSSDRTPQLLARAQQEDSSIKSIILSRNFGHQIALTAGLEYCCGDAIIIIDADLQDPPELAGELLSKWREGYEVVYGIRRIRHGESLFKKFTAFLFYRLLNRVIDFNLPSNVGDFRLIDRKVADALLSMPENNRFIRGMVAWLGFRQIGILYDREERTAGVTKYPFKKMVALASNALFGFSNVPLQVIRRLGLTIISLSFGYGIYAVVQFFLHNTVRGWASLAALIVFFGGLQILILGIMGEYIARIHSESKKRPLFVVRELVGIKPREVSKRPAAPEEGEGAGFETRLRDLT